MFGPPKDTGILGKLGLQTEEKSASSRVMDSISTVVPTFQEEPVSLNNTLLTILS